MDINLDSFIALERQIRQKTKSIELELKFMPFRYDSGAYIDSYHRLITELSLLYKQKDEFMPVLHGCSSTLEINSQYLDKRAWLKVAVYDMETLDYLGNDSVHCEPGIQLRDISCLSALEITGTHCGKQTATVALHTPQYFVIDNESIAAFCTKKVLPDS